MESLATRRLFLAVPVLAVVIVGIFVYVSVYDPSPPVSFRTMLIINIQRLGSPNASRAFPAAGIGLPGGIMNTTRYLSDGISGRYPVYTLDRTGLIYVQSRVTRAYTLGDFFQVWGENLGENYTLDLHYHNGTDTCGRTLCSPFYWTMCVEAPDSTIFIPVPGVDMSSHVLVGQEIIVLAYSQIGCA